MITISNTDQSKSKFYSDMEFIRFGLICIIITVIGCLGGTAVGMGAIKNTLALSAVLTPTMSIFSILPAVAPMKQIFISAPIRVLRDILLIIFYLFN